MTYDFDPVDISSAALWGQPMRERDEAFAILRTRSNLTFHRSVEVGSAPGSRGFWAVTRHADIMYVSRRPGEFCSGEGIGYSDIPKELNEPFGSFIMTDAPRHTHLRHLVSRAFTPKQVAKIEEQILNQACVIVADALEMGAGDAVANLSRRLPLWTISEMLGVPAERRDELQEAANMMVSASDPRTEASGVDSFHALFSAAITLSTLGSELAAERRDVPKDDLLTGLVQAEIEGARLTDQEIGSFVVLLAVAGNDTSRNTISQAVLAFADNPDQWDLLRSDPERWLPSAVEEILRWSTPVMTMRRTATADTTVGDQAIAKGDYLVMFYPSGNRDESVFTDPWKFDITRTPNPHIAFGGGGPHYCLGANLARTQLRSVFAQLAKSVTSFQAGEPERLHSAFINGIISLDYSFERG